MNFIAKNLKYLRTKEGLTQQQIADEIFKSRESYSQWECGVREPDLATAIEIAKYYNVSVEKMYHTDISKELSNQLLPTVKCTMQHQGM